MNKNFIKLFTIIFLVLFTTLSFANGFNSNWYNNDVYVKIDTLSNNRPYYTLYPYNSDSLKYVPIHDTLKVNNTDVSFINGELRTRSAPAHVNYSKDLYGGVNYIDYQGNRYVTEYSSKKPRKIYYYKNTDSYIDNSSDLEINYRYGDKDSWINLQYRYSR
jgi:hypothetical protein